MNDPRHLRELGELLGTGGVLTDPVDLIRYTEPFRGASGPTPAVVRPASLDEVRQVVRWGRRHRVGLLPQGANTGLVGASTPPPQDGGSGVAPIVVSLERLDPPPVVDPVDRTAVVGAGTRLSRLNEEAGRHGLVLPIDLGADPSIGGMAATNTGGARMVRHGDMRRRVLGVRAVIADEDCSVVDELSTLRKHNTGPSLSQLFIGSSAAFGIITDVALDLAQLPASRACAWVVPRDPDVVLEVLLVLERNHGTWLEAFEVVSKEALDAALSHGRARRPFDAGEDPPLSVLVEFAGDTGAEDRLVAALAELSDGGLIDDAVVADAGSAWMPRHAVSEGLRQMGTVAGFDVSVPRPSLPEFRRRVRAAVRDVAPDAVVADFGHWADGGIHCNVVLPRQRRSTGTGAQDLARLEDLREVVLGIVVHEFSGSFSAEHGIGPHNARWWTATTPEPVRELIRAMKRLFDPLGILGHPGLPYR